MKRARSPEDPLPVRRSSDEPAASRRVLGPAASYHEGRVLVRADGRRGRELRDHGAGVRAHLRRMGSPDGWAGRRRRISGGSTSAEFRSWSAGWRKQIVACGTATRQRKQVEAGERHAKAPDEQPTASPRQVVDARSGERRGGGVVLGRRQEATLKALLYRVKDGPRRNQSSWSSLRGTTSSKSRPREHAQDESGLSRERQRTWSARPGGRSVRRARGVDAARPRRRSRCVGCQGVAGRERDGFHSRTVVLPVFLGGPPLFLGGDYAARVGSRGRLTAGDRARRVWREVGSYRGHEAGHIFNSGQNV